ncbi:MAG: hypothetical protein KF819_33265 [Labilithrix sp.]|nr:hypothetical protein [Labilithrix sp.]
MKNSRSLSLFGFFVAIGVAAACSSSDTNGTGGGDAGVDSDAPPSNDDAGVDASQPPVDGGDAASDANDGGGRSGLNQSKKIVDLDEAERRQLCDWTASIQGGYGVIRQCDGGNVPSAPNQQACVDGVPDDNCEVTVAEYETCAVRFAADACTAFGSVECAPIVACQP